MSRLVKVLGQPSCCPTFLQRQEEMMRDRGSFYTIAPMFSFPVELPLLPPWFNPCRSSSKQLQQATQAHINTSQTENTLILPKLSHWLWNLHAAQWQIAVVYIESFLRVFIWTMLFLLETSVGLQMNSCGEFEPLLMGYIMGIHCIFL